MLLCHHRHKTPLLPVFPSSTMENHFSLWREPAGPQTFSPEKAESTLTVPRKIASWPDCPHPHRSKPVRAP